MLNRKLLPHVGTLLDYWVKQEEVSKKIKQAGFDGKFFFVNMRFAVLACYGVRDVFDKVFDEIEYMDGPERIEAQLALIAVDMPELFYLDEGEDAVKYAVKVLTHLEMSQCEKYKFLLPLFDASNLLLDFSNLTFDMIGFPPEGSKEFSRDYLNDHFARVFGFREFEKDEDFKATDIAVFEVIFESYYLWLKQSVETVKFARPDLFNNL